MNGDCIEKCPEGYSYKGDNHCADIKSLNKYSYQGNIVDACPDNYKADDFNICRSVFSCQETECINNSNSKCDYIDNIFCKCTFCFSEDIYCSLLVPPSSTNFCVMLSKSDPTQQSIIILKVDNIIDNMITNNTTLTNENIINLVNLVGNSTNSPVLLNKTLTLLRISFLITFRKSIRLS